METSSLGNISWKEGLCERSCQQVTITFEKLSKGGTVSITKKKPNTRLLDSFSCWRIFIFLKGDAF